MKISGKKIPISKSEIGEMRQIRKHTFRNFYLGRSNVAAYILVLFSVVFPGCVVNPLFIYGVSGVGKTHLLRAVQNAYWNFKPSRRSVYTTARELCDELLKCIKNGKACEINDKTFRGADIVMIDYLQYVVDKKASQDELARIILFACDRKQQVILASDRPLEEFHVLNDRLRTRCQPPPREVNIPVLIRNLGRR